jgi:chorismate mutase/prephenate dehydratase
LRKKESVDGLRKKIDELDEEIAELLNKRASFALRIGRAKSLEKEEVYVPGRENQILQRVAARNRGPLSEQAIRSIYREILSASRSLEAPLTIAYLGPEASFTHMAARERFGSAASFAPFAAIPDVFYEVVQDRVSYGVVPVENSTEGAVGSTLDMLVESDAKICAEVSVPVHLSLLSRSGRLDNVRRVISHPHALAQCRRWLAGHCAGVEIGEAASTAEAAKIAVENPDIAAVASRLAGECYGLATIAANIEDHANNATRFLVLGRQASRPSGRDKTSIVFSVKDEVGILHRMLAPFARNRINLTKIESRPLKHKRWEYLFFLDCEGHIESAPVARAVKKLEESCLFLKILGSYPAGV